MSSTTTTTTTTAASKPLRVNDAVRILGRLAPLELAGGWDNVGLLMEPSGNREVNHITATIDLTEPVLEEAIAAGSQMIISYHPPIFSAMKRLTQSSVKERIAIRALEAGIAVYSPHTALDATEGGINDWLASGLGELESCEVLEPQKEQDRAASYKFVSTVSTEAEATALLNRLTAAGAKNATSFQCVRLGAETGYRVEAAGTLQTFAGVIAESNGEERKGSLGVYEVTQLQAIPSTVRGQGRKAVLKEGLPLQTIIERVKKHLNLPHVRLAVAEGKDVKTAMVKTVAICAGSGASVIGRVKADLYWTGEMGHHDVLAAVAKGTNVILCEHTNTERGYLKVFRERLLRAFQEAAAAPIPEVVLSTKDADPLVVA